MARSLQHISSANRGTTTYNTTKTRKSRNNVNYDYNEETKGGNNKGIRSPLQLLIRWFCVFSSLWMIWMFMVSRRILLIHSTSNNGSGSSSSIGLNDEISQYPIEALLNQQQQNHRPTDINNHHLSPPPPATNVVNEHLLTIAVDRRHSCPDICTWAHIVLPNWVKYRYISFEDENDIATTIEEVDEMLSKQQGQNQPTHHHVLIVARTNIIKLANWAVARRSSSSKSLNNTTTKSVSIGLWHYADERNYQGEINNVYHKFDYVIRHYWGQEFWDTGGGGGEDSDGKKMYGYTLHALGNYTCGTKPQQLPILGGNNDGGYGPKWGVHWAFLNSHEMNVQLERSPTSTWPISLRPTNCSFIGRKDVKRSKGERAAMDVAIKSLSPELNCQITFTKGFTAGNTKFRYFNYDLGRTKIGLSPRGSAKETHRLTELLRMGTVPAIVDAPYLHAPFRDVPAIIGSNWSQVALKMNDLMGNTEALTALSSEGAQFYVDLEACMMADMDFILRGAFGI